MTVDLESLTRPSAERGSNSFKSLRELHVWLAQDFKNLICYVCRCHNYKPARIQLMIADALQLGYPTVLLQCFRGASKSFMVDCYILWRWHRYINTKVLLLSAKEYNACKHVRNIQAIIRRCPALSHLAFSKATATGLQLAGAATEGDPSLNTSGINASIEGSRADLIIPDDTEVKSNSTSPALRDKLLNRFSEVAAILHPAGRHCSNQDCLPLPERTQAVFVGTPQSEFSVYNVPEGDEPHPLRDAHRIIIPALHDGRSTFPERFTGQQLHLKKAQMSSPEWYLQMMLSPDMLDKQEQVLKWDQLIKVTTDIKDAIVTVDPAGDSGTGKDEAAICVTGVDIKDGRTVHVKYLMGYKSFTGVQVVTEALRLAKEYKAHTILVESNLSAYASLFQATAEHLKQSVRIVPIRSTVQKRQRLIESLEVPINSGRVSFDPAVLKDKATAMQFKTFTFAAEPEPNDRIDALSLSLIYWDERGLFKYSSAFRFETCAMPPCR